MRAIAIVFLLLAAGGLGYWFGGQQQKLGAGGTAPETPTAQAGKKVLYYRNPMGLPDTSPVPKKDPMGMDYIPVYEGEDEGSDNSVKLSTAMVQKLGVRTEAAQLRDLSRPIRAVGRVEVDERRVLAVAPKFEGWIERLHANASGQTVARGQPLFEAYSPELVSTQREYQIAARGAHMLTGEGQASLRQVAEAALARLSNWDVSAEQIERLKAGGEPARTLTYRSPATGVILEKKALQGQRFMPGEALYQIADLSSVWVIAEVFEHDLAAVRLGQAAEVVLDAYPGKIFTGKVSYISPVLNAQTRTEPVRIELANPGGLLKPAMYANVELAAAAGRKVLTVPISAVIDGGASQRVLVQLEAGRFEPREVKLGQRGDDYVEVAAGLKEGEQVVVAANFLIDSESNLKAALRRMQDAKPAISHRAVGRVESIGTNGSVLVAHEPVASLGWPKMTMEFMLANPSLLARLQPGAAIHFEFVERKPGEWVITNIEKR